MSHKSHPPAAPQHWDDFFTLRPETKKSATPSFDEIELNRLIHSIATLEGGGAMTSLDFAAAVCSSVRRVETLSFAFNLEALPRFAE
jgi:hypothetical protein